jgi:hypothetical protein
MITPRPSHHLAGRHVQKHGRVPPAFCGPEIGEVATPRHLGGFHITVTLQQIGRHCLPLTTLGRWRTPTAAARHRYPGLFHHTTPRDAPSFIPRLWPLFGEATTPITMARLFSNRREALQQIALFTTACRGSLTPVVVVQSTATNSPYRTQHHDRPGVLVVGDEGVSQRASWAKQAVAFVKLSRSLRRRLTS